ncbi:unnamed protein product [Linum trigynum]|uniref:Uncharacterized protein n=1 Tax=Linum trigynum TaxID=586398 RepID=A0AAV2GMR9_9ROSI
MTGLGMAGRGSLTDTRPRRAQLGWHQRPVKRWRGTWNPSTLDFGWGWIVDYPPRNPPGGLPVHQNDVVSTSIQTESRSQG